MLAPALALPASHDAADAYLWPRWPYAILLVLGAIDIVWMAVSPLSLSASSLGTIATTAALVAVLLWGARRMRHRSGIYVMCSGLAFISAAWPILRLFNHLTMATGIPLADPLLSGWDQAIGFDWLAYVAWLDRQPWLLAVMNWTYINLNLYSCAFFVAIALFPARRENCFEFIALFVVSAAICMGLGMFFPAEAAMLYYTPDLSGFERVHPAVGTYHIEPLMALRDGSATMLEITQLPGLVTFPSFHTAMGVVLIYACRHNRWLFAFSLLVNLSMIASTPLYGSHYGVDILGGIAAALATIAIVRRVARAAPKHGDERSSEEAVVARGAFPL